MSSIDPELLVQLGRHRWAVALIAMLAERRGARFVELLHALATNRESLTRTLQSCVAAGWVMRNPGHGHPLRPEYILTENGWRMAGLCQSIEDSRLSIGLPPASFTRWGLPILHVNARGATRFAAITTALPRSNPRALTQSLKSLIGQDLLGRSVVDAYPPTTEYHLRPRGVRMAEALR